MQTVRDDVKLHDKEMHMYDYLNWGKHRYTLAATGIKFRGGEYFSRQIAEHDMHRFMGKHGLSIQEVYDDKHYKTYVCQDGIKFYINRM